MKRRLATLVAAVIIGASVMVSHAATLHVTAATLQFIESPADIPPPDPGTSTDEEDCKQGGHSHWVRANGQGFNNQGQCISYVNSGGVLYPKP